VCPVVGLGGGELGGSDLDRDPLRCRELPAPGTTISSVGTSSLVVFALTVLGWFKIR